MDHLQKITLLIPFESILEDEKFLKSEGTRVTLSRHDLYMDSKIENNKIELRPKYLYLFLHQAQCKHLVLVFLAWVKHPCLLLSQ